jgi:hypothetical protein
MVMEGSEQKKENENLPLNHEREIEPFQEEILDVEELEELKRRKSLEDKAEIKKTREELTELERMTEEIRISGITDQKFLEEENSKRPMTEDERMLMRLGIERDPRGKIILYHVALGKNYFRIEKDKSIKPARETNNRQWRLEWEEGEKMDKVYLATKESAEDIAKMLQNKYGGSAYIIEVHVDENGLAPDEDSHQNNWQKSLEWAFKTCAYRGEIEDFKIVGKKDFSLSVKKKNEYLNRLYDVEKGSIEEKNILREFDEETARAALDEEKLREEINGAGEK